MTTAPKYLPIILAVLTGASLVGYVVLACLGHPAEAGTAEEFAAVFAGTLLGVHIPAPSQTPPSS